MNGKKRSFYIAAFTVICAAGIVTIADRQEAKNKENANQIELAQEGDRRESIEPTSVPADEPAKVIWDDNINIDEVDEIESQENLAEDSKEETETEPTKKATKEPVKSVEAPVYSFDEEEGLSWPVNGEVIMKYSMETPVFYETTQTFRTSDGILIKAEVGKDVVASSDGIVKSIYTSDEKGNVVEMDIGDGYTVSYGQLKDVSVKVGDEVKCEEKIGKTGDPTSYYMAEGCHVYMQVKEDGKEVDPLLLLK